MSLILLFLKNIAFFKEILDLLKRTPEQEHEALLARIAKEAQNVKATGRPLDT